MDWDCIDLVVFDVDGTLYDQRALRIRMAWELCSHTLSTLDFTVPQTLRAYRKLRENMADEEIEDFETELIGKTADSTGAPSDKIRAVVEEWIELRPLSHLAALRFTGLVELFSRLKRKGKSVGIFSDYPAAAKLAALGLAADFVVSAGDAGVKKLKPHPRGLEVLMKVAQAVPARTILIGDRGDRDGLAARRAGAACLIRSSKPLNDWRTFARYDDAVFSPILMG
jgi:putative hydrolase of the HAD superfamily